MRYRGYQETLARAFSDACALLSPAAGAAPVQKPRDPRRGDYVCAAAIPLAAALKQNPRGIAETILQKTALPDFVESADIAGAGYINVKISAAAKLAVIGEVLRRGEEFGRAAAKNETVLLEFVSANPTGPLHIGHGRAAAYGDSLAKILDFAGYEVWREYYVNDAGRQADILAASAWLRFFFPDGEMPDGAYQGEYLRAASPAAEQFLRRAPRPDIEKLRAALRGKSPDDAADALAAAMRAGFESRGECENFIRAAAESVLAMIKRDLAAMNVVFNDNEWFSERAMRGENKIAGAIDLLRRDGENVYEKDGALWFRASAFGDDKDRVLRRANGEYTYFAADVAYHRDKFSRPAKGRLRLLNILGADHHGYITRLSAAAAAMGYDADLLETQLIQFVALINDGRRAKMSTRAGEFVPLKALVDEIGADAARFFYVSRKNDQHLDFDIKLAMDKSRKNPVHYLQYAHARAASVFRKWGTNTDFLTADCKILADTPAALELCMRMEEFPAAVARAAKDRAVHSLTAFLQEFAAALHNYYEQTPILGAPNHETLLARLAALAAAKTVLKTGLTLLGMSAPESM